jgi:hypothetical protein
MIFYNYSIETENDKQNLINCLRAVEQHNKDYPEEYLKKFIKYLQTYEYNEYAQKLFFILKDYVTADQAIDIVKATFVDD